MAKITSALVLSLLLVLVIQSAVWADEMGHELAKGAVDKMADSAADAVEAAGDSASFWTHWFTGNLKNYGLYQSGNDEQGQAAAP